MTCKTQIIVYSDKWPRLIDILQAQALKIMFIKMYLFIEKHYNHLNIKW